VTELMVRGVFRYPFGPMVNGVRLGPMVNGGPFGPMVHWGPFGSNGHWGPFGPMPMFGSRGKIDTCAWPQVKTAELRARATDNVQINVLEPKKNCKDNPTTYKRFVVY